jgi:integrase/recombinase XerD
MLRDLCPRHHHLYEQSRFAAELEAFACWLQNQGHLRQPARGHLYRARQALERTDRVQSGGLFSEQDLREAFTVSGPRAYLGSCTRRIFVRFLAATGRLAPVEPVDALDLLRGRYHQYLSDVRGFAAQTLRHHGSTVRDFLSRGLPPDRGLSRLVATDVEAYVQLKSKENKRQSLQHVIAHLRAFLRYCADRGETGAGLGIIDTPRVYRGELPPRALDWPIVQKLLASIRRRSPRDWRDYTILHLMAYYGLRPSEVASLQLRSIDWEAGALRVEQRKTHSVLLLPLANRTRHLLRRYLVAGRPISDFPHLFLRVRSPIRPIKHYGVIEIFNYRVERSGLPLNGASSYALRHAFAMRLLRRGVGIKAIGDLLGHRCLEATSVYLRIDADMLRPVALSVPRTTTARGADHD